MTVPTEDQLATAVATWRDASVGIDAIGANTPAYNQIFVSLDGLVDAMFADIDDVSEAAATAVLTSSANYADGETVVIGLIAGGTKTYTFQSTLTNIDGHVKVGASEVASMLNLHHAINGTGGVAGTDYAASTTAHPNVTATDNGTHALTITAKEVGSAYNAITTTETSANASWGSATMTGGAGDDLDTVLAEIDTWRDTLRCYPLNVDSDAEDQLDTAIPGLKTSIAALFT